MKPKISNREFEQRIINTQREMLKEGIDVLFAFGNETEPQYVRYYSNYWPNFELAGVVVPAKGSPILVIGPESMTYASQTSKIKNIKKVLAFRESSEPEYPEADLDELAEVMDEAMLGGQIKKIGLAGSCLITKVAYDALEEAAKKLGNAKIVKSDMLVSKLRAIKSEMEIACMQEAYRITQCSLKYLLQRIRIGMTEEQARGLAVSKMYEEGAEGEAYPCWILAGENSNLAIGRCRQKVIQAGDMVQIQIGARYEGYASTMGRAIVMGKATDAQRGIIEASLSAQRAILSTAKAGINASVISKLHRKVLRDLGYEKFILYGPCHGTGLMEGEYPWIESLSDFQLQNGMTFCTCLYLGDDVNKVGVRIEDGFMVTEEGTYSFSDYRREVIEIY